MTSQDREHLNILSILHFVYGGLMAFGGLFPLIYAFLGGAMLSGSFGTGPGAPLLPLALYLSCSASGSA